MGLLSSPRRRRRLAWASVPVVLVGIFLLVNALLPSHAGPVRTSPNEVQGGRSPFAGDTGELRAAERTRVVVQPLANTFVEALIHGRARSSRLLAPGTDVPSVDTSSTSGGASVAFSGRTTAGFVAGLAPRDPADDEILVAIRFDKHGGKWLVDYLHQGHASSRIAETSYSPAGFVPGSRHETFWTIAILVLGFAGLVAVVVVADRRLSRDAPA
jgi:hypothetical protein